MGPATKSGDRAHGKYQIMGANIGPWSKEILGQELTPQEFLASPQAQDAVFQGKFSQYVDKYGPEGAAQAWIGGPGGVGKVDRKDGLGTSIGAYGQRFMAGLPSGGGTQNPPAPVSSPPQSQIQAPQAAPAFNAPPQQQAALPAYSWSPGQGAQADQGQMQQPAPLAIPQMQAPQMRRVDPSQLLALLRSAPPSVRALISRG